MVVEYGAVVVSAAGYWGGCLGFACQLEGGEEVGEGGDEGAGEVVRYFFPFSFRSRYHDSKGKLKDEVYGALFCSLFKSPNYEADFQCRCSLLSGTVRRHAKSFDSFVDISWSLFVTLP